MLDRKTVLVLVALAGLALGCAPKVVRGGEGTGNPQVDQAALSVGLDREDINYLVKQNIDSLADSNFWQREITGGDRPTMAIWPIENRTTRHMEDELLTILSSIETSLVNTGEVRVVARSRQEALIDEIGWERVVDTVREVHGEAGLDPFDGDIYGPSYVVWMGFLGLISCAVWQTSVLRACAAESPAETCICSRRARWRSSTPGARPR